MTETREIQASAVFGVPSFAVGNKLKDLMQISKYGKNKVISCCVLENNLPSTMEGCIRRCTLSLKKFQGAALREKAIRLTHSESLTIAVLEYLPCTESEISRSPFGPEGTTRLKSAVTTYSAHKVTNSPNRCFVDFNTKLEIETNPKGDECEEKELIRAIEYFWTSFLENLLLSLEAEVLSEAYPVLSGKIDTEFRNAYEAHEETFCTWAATSRETFPRQLVLENYESVLVCWSRVLQEYRHQKMIAETVQADVAGAKKVAEESARQLACSEAALEAMKKKVEELSDPPCFYRPPNSEENTNANDRRHPDIAASKTRQMYHTASTTNPSQPPNALKEAAGRTGSTESQTETVEAAMPKSNAVIPTKYSPEMLRNIFTERGELNEPEVKVLFKVLDQKSNHFVTADEIKTILMPMDHLGLYEDQDGTLDELERNRASIKELYAARYSRNSPPKTYPPSAPIPDEPVSSALERMVRNHNEVKEAKREAAMHRVADDTVNRFCFRESGKVYFDEFCLAIMHLFKI